MDHYLQCSYYSKLIFFSNRVKSQVIHKGKIVKIKALGYNRSINLSRIRLGKAVFY